MTIKVVYIATLLSVQYISNVMQGKIIFSSCLDRFFEGIFKIQDYFIHP